MSEEKSSYKQIMKATSLFGGVQVVNIIIGIVRSKFIAVLLGPEGMGIAGLLNTTTGFISGLTNFGLGTSAVKNVSAANGTGDTQRVGEVVAVLRRLVWFTGLLGMVLTIILSPWLSELTFGNRDYTLAFIWISVTLLLNQISSGQSAVLQGMRQLKYLAQSSVSGALIGLFISVPIYYLWGIDGIVPAIIISSVAAFFRTWYFARKVPIEKVHPTPQITKTVGKEILSMGFMLSLSGLFILAKDYGLKTLIGNIGSVKDVGLYTAGVMIVTKYVGLVFTSMGTDYYPRLSSVSSDNEKSNIMVLQQLDISILIISPIINFLIAFSGLFLVVLYSNAFREIETMIRFAALGTFFKSISWSMAFLFLAKGDKKLFLFNEVFGGTITFIAHVTGYLLGGLTGLGVGIFIGNVYYLFQVYILTSKNYKTRFRVSSLKLILIQLLFVLICITSVLIFDSYWKIVIPSLSIILSLLYSFSELNKRVSLKEFYDKIIKKLRSK